MVDCTYVYFLVFALYHPTTTITIPLPLYQCQDHAYLISYIVNYLLTPYQITVPLLETLVTEMRKARERNLPFDFSHYIMIS